MSLIFQLPEILEESKKEYEKIIASKESRPFVPVEKKDDGDGSVLAYGDNIELISQLIHEHDMAGKLQLVYMDPPFYSNASYDAVIKLKSPYASNLVA